MVHDTRMARFFAFDFNLRFSQLNLILSIQIVSPFSFRINFIKKTNNTSASKFCTLIKHGV